MKQATLVLVVGLALPVFGGTAGKIPEAPRARGSVVEVVTTFEDMPASDIERTITNRIERWVNQATGVTRIESRSLTGVSIVRVSFRAEVESATALKQVNALALGTLPTLPAGTLPAVVFLRDRDEAMIGVVALDGPAKTEVDLKEIANRIVRDKLAELPGISPLPAIGGKERVILVSLDPKKLEARSLSPLDVITALQLNKNTPRLLGVQKDSFEIEVRPVSKDSERLGDLIVRAEKGADVFLRDVGTVMQATAVQAELLRVDDRRTVCVPVYRRPNADDAADTVRKTLPAIEKKLDGVRLRWLLSSSEKQRLTLFLRGKPELSLAEMEKAVADVEGFLKINLPAEDRKEVISDIGIDVSVPGRSFGWNTGPQDATIRVQLAGKAADDAAAVVNRLRQRFAGEKQFAALAVWFQVGDAIHPPVRIRITGKDWEALTSAAVAIRKVASDRPENAIVTVAPSAPAYRIEVDRERAAALGLTATDVLFHASAALGSRMYKPTQDTVTVRGPLARPLDDALNTMVVGRKEKAVKLNALVVVKRTLEPTEIVHIGLERVAEVWVQSDARPAAIEERIKGVELPEGVTVEVRAE